MSDKVYQFISFGSRAGSFGIHHSNVSKTNKKGACTSLIPIKFGIDVFSAEGVLKITAIRFPFRFYRSIFIIHLVHNEIFLTQIVSIKLIIEIHFRTIFSPTVMRFYIFIFVSLLDPDSSTLNIRKEHFGYLRILSFCLSRSIHRHQENIFFTGKVLYIINLEQITFKTIRILRIIRIQS